MLDIAISNLRDEVTGQYMKYFKAYKWAREELPSYGKEKNILSLYTA